MIDRYINKLSGNLLQHKISFLFMCVSPFDLVTSIFPCETFPCTVPFIVHRTRFSFRPGSKGKESYVFYIVHERLSNPNLIYEHYPE